MYVSNAQGAYDSFTFISCHRLWWIPAYAMDKIHRFGAVKSVNVVEYAAGSDSATEDNIIKLEDRPVKIECTGSGDTENVAKAGSESSVLNQSIDILTYPDAAGTKDVNLIPEGQDQKDEHIRSDAALCETEVPVADERIHIDDTRARATPPRSQYYENDYTEAAADEDKHTEAADATTTTKDDAVEKRDQDPSTSEICTPAEPEDEVEKPGRDFEQQGSIDVTEVRAEKVPAAETSDPVFKFEPGSVLVEFMRKEAACMAAHSLHGRHFGNRTVHAGYAPYDLYLQKYPR